MYAAASVGGITFFILACSKRAREMMFAAVYGGAAKYFVYWLTADCRDKWRRSIAMRGSVCEVGAGDGGQLEYLCGRRAPDVREVVCVEPNPSFHGTLRKQMEAVRLEAAAAGIDVKLRLFAGTLRELREAEPMTRFDVVATLLVLCSVPEPREALRDCAALLKRPGPGIPGGSLVYMEHVAAGNVAMRAFQRLNQYTYWWAVGDGCQLCRDTAEALEVVSAEAKWTRTLHERHPFMLGLFPVICGTCEAG